MKVKREREREGRREVFHLLVVVSLLSMLCFQVVTLAESLGGYESLVDHP